MTPDRWQQIKAVLNDALEREEALRTAFLEAACQDDDELRREVESLLASEAEIGDFIETPVFRIHGEAEPLAVGQRIGAYRIVRELGRGGMGSVYLAERADEEFEQRVALKVVRRGMDTDEIVRRFRSERQILAHLDHPNIAKLFDGGTTEDGRPYFVMEHVEGQPIDQYCDERKLSVRERLELFRRVCSAVHLAHQNLIVHRDLKPGNILVTADGVPKLLDFGIAKLLDPGQEAFALTRANVRPMTPEYASPEQVRGEAITTASDVYSLGVLLYVLLTGHPPYRPVRRDPQSLAKAICETDPPRPSSIIRQVGEGRRPDGTSVELTPESVSRVREGEARLLRRRLAGDLDNIVLMAMSKDPKRRYASVDQLSNDIGRHLEGWPVVARKDTLGYRARKFVGRHKGGVTLAALVLLLIVGSSVAVTVLWQHAVREQQRAKAVSEFLVDLFTISNPSESRGETVTAREMLDEGAKKIEKNLESQPELRAEMMETMGRVYGSIGLYKRARPLLETALLLRRQELGNNDLRVASTLHNLANVLRGMDEDDVAERLIQEALRIQRSQRATKNLDYASGLTNLGALLKERGELDEAEKLLLEGLALKRTLPEADPGELAGSLNNLGTLYQTRGDLAKAKRYLTESLEIRRTLTQGQPNQELANSLNNLGTLLQDLNELAGAEACHLDALQMRRKLLGDRHPKVARSLNNLGKVRQLRGDVAEAESYFREALSIADEQLEPEHTDRAIYLRNLASVLVTLGKHVEGEALARESLAIFRTDDPDSWRVPDAESVLGSCLTVQGRFKEAEPILIGSYTVLAKDSGDGAKQVPEALKRIVDLYAAWGKPEQAAVYRAKL
ncbi:MAG TPA: tetratricopeptide repeat protein [Thermoanaerobaculia bacterium]|nr:tetratricopeptide repeat protein [Thermoanaerobaculia bacterium]